MSETIENLTAERVGWTTREQVRVGWNKPDWYFRDCWAAQQRGDLLFLVSRDDEELLGWTNAVASATKVHSMNLSSSGSSTTTRILEQGRMGLATPEQTGNPDIGVKYDGLRHC